MGKGRRILATVLLWGGGALLGFGVLLVIPRLLPLAESAVYTNRIPTAPPLVVTATQASGDPGVLLPFAAGNGGGNTEALLQTGTPALNPTMTPKPTASPPLDTPTATQSMATPTPTPTPVPSPTPTPAWTGTVPVNVAIPSIDLDAPVVPIGTKTVIVGDTPQAMWDVPNWRAAGWHNTSANIGVPGNTVLNGHNTSHGEVFRDLYKTEIGAQVFIEGEDGNVYVYRIAEKYILREAGQPLSVRLENARYIAATSDERLTFVTCHPYGSLANRLVVIAYPAESHDGPQ